MSSNGFGHSKEFLDLVKSIGECRSKAEEDRIVFREIETLKRCISDPHTPKRKLKEYIIRLVYVEMLGHDASFGYIHAVKMTHDEILALKRTGYLAVTLFLNEDHDLIILIVNTIQKDLKSDNYLVVCAALNAVCRLINEETIPAVLPQVVDLIGHPKEDVRKKAIMALHRFHLRSPGSVNHLIANFRKKLSDNDPGVMGATLCPLFDLIKLDANAYKDLVGSFVSILKQVAERRLPKSYDYHQMPAPFIQIKLLKILAILGADDKQASGHMYTVVGDIMRKCDSSTNIGNAVLYECLCCVSSIHPNTKLLEIAAEAISKFLKTDTHNLKYMGIDAISRLIKISPEIAEQHQLAVIDCLEDPDDTLKRKTFELLYKMTKSSNVEVIVDRMIDYMVNINDNHYKTETASRCVDLAEQFAPSNQWFIQTMNRVFEHAGDLLDSKLAHNLMRLIAEGFKEEDDTADGQLRSFAVESYLQIIGEPKLPSAFLQVICWVLGEYGTMDGNYSASYVTGKLCDVVEAHSADDTVKGYVLTALMKIYAFEKAAGRKVDMLPECQALIEELSASHSTDLQQRAYEFQALIDLEVNAVERIMPLDASCEDIEIDKSLPFLNDYIQQSIEKGAQPYIPESERVGALDISSLGNPIRSETLSHSLRFEAYELPKPVVPSMSQPVSLSSSSEFVAVPEPSYPREFHQTPVVHNAPDSSSSELKLRLDGVHKKWGQPSYTSSPQQPVNVVKQSDRASNKIGNSNLYDKKKAHVDIIPEEKQKLAASLFGVPSKPEKRQASKTVKFPEPSKEKAQVPHQPPPDLLDLGDTSSAVSSAPSVDPFMQLEGLLDLEQYAPPANPGSSDSSKLSDFISLYADMTISGNGDDLGNLGKMTGLSNESACTVLPPTQMSKGPNLKEALEKDARVRQMGVNPTKRNPNLFSDLLG